MAASPLTFAQKEVKSVRRVVQRVKPDYPEVMRNAHISAIVNMNVTISPGGNVTHIEVLGGSAIFAESATRALLKWRFAPAAAESTELVQINFNPDFANR